MITRPEEFYRLWCVVMCDLETSRMWRPWPALGRNATREKNIVKKAVRTQDVTNPVKLPSLYFIYM